jgi:hypothetical protein
MELLKKQISAPSLAPELKALKQGKLEELLLRREKSRKPAPRATAHGNHMEVDFLPIEASMPDSPVVKEMIQRYESEVSLENLAWARAHAEDCPPPSGAVRHVVGNKACEGCHAPAFERWASSKHAQAYRTLVKAGRQYDFDCVSCHVTGHQQAGGVCRIDRVLERDFVGCESCHGPGSAHVEAPTRANIDRARGVQACVGCHDRENSPHFDYGLYLPEILGRGHGQPHPPTSLP